MNKKCNKCHETKPLTDFYKFKDMVDGYRNECKSCRKMQTKNAYIINRKNPDWVKNVKESARLRAYKYKKIRDNSKRKGEADRYINKYPEKYNARMFRYKLPKLDSGFNYHHWSYCDEHLTDCIILSIPEHNKLHRYMVYDQERKMYRRCDNNELLDTKERHLDYYNSLKNKP